MKKKICLNINFDSLFFPLTIDRTKTRDPSYFVIADRFMEEARRRKFRYTIFVIGRDLENKEVFARVREWAREGHEIGNHTWSHFPNVGMLAKNLIEEEVLRSHEIIARCTGREPRGFVSPSWNISPDLIEVVTKAGYLYDTSIFPSPLIIPALLKLQVKSIRHKNINFSWLHRKDKAVPFFAPCHAYFIQATNLVKGWPEGLLEIPLPTAWPRLPCWHTMAFVLGLKGMRWLIRRTAQSTDMFYYMLHPADLIDPDKDLDADFKRIHWKELGSFERLDISFAKKWALFQAALDEIQSLGTVVTLEEMARDKLLAMKS